MQLDQDREENNVILDSSKAAFDKLCFVSHEVTLKVLHQFMECVLDVQKGVLDDCTRIKALLSLLQGLMHSGSPGDVSQRLCRCASERFIQLIGKIQKYLKMWPPRNMESSSISLATEEVPFSEPLEQEQTVQVLIPIELCHLTAPG